MKTLAWYGTCIIYKWMNFDFLSIRLNSRMCLLYSEISLSPIRIEAKWKRWAFILFEVGRKSTVGRISVTWGWLHTYSLLELHISITESKQITNTQIYKYTTYKVAKEKQMENN